MTTYVRTVPPAWEQDGNGTPAAQNRTSLYAVDP